MDITDKRYFLWRHVKDYPPVDNDEALSREKVLQFMESSEKCFENDNLPGHITGSALVIDTSMTSTLLTHHVKLNRWLQFGGHSDGDANTFSVALREATEESGLKSLTFRYPYTGIFDIDVHPIPANEKLTDHHHYDIRILLIADISEPYIINHESKNLRWIPIKDVRKYNQQHAFLRLIRKVSTISPDQHSLVSDL